MPLIVFRFYFCICNCVFRRDEIQRTWNGRLAQCPGGACSANGRSNALLYALLLAGSESTCHARRNLSSGYLSSPKN
jgi:hypothetical protein